MQNKPCGIINMSRQSADAQKKSNTEAKSLRNSRSSMSLCSNSGNVSKIPCCIRTGSKSKPQSESRLRKKDKPNKTEDDGNFHTQVSLTANIETIHQEKLNEVILRSSQHEKDILSNVEDIFYRKISSPENKSAPLDVLESENINLKSKLKTVTNKQNVTIHNPVERKIKSLGKGDDISEAKQMKLVQKIMKKSSMKKPFISKDQENTEDKSDNLKNVDVLCNATTDKNLKKCRPTTAPTKTNDCIQIIRKSASFIRYSEKTLASKIPILLKPTNESNNKGSIEKSETSPELQTDVGYSENIRINVKGSKRNTHTSSRIPARLRSTTARSKKHRVAKRRNASKRGSHVKSCNASDEPPIEPLPTNKLKLVILTSPEADASKSANNMTMGATPNINIKEDNGLYELKIDNPTYSSRIPIGVHSSAGISSINAKEKQIRNTRRDKMPKLRKNLVKRMINYQVMSVPIIAYLKRPKGLNFLNKENWKYEDIDKGKHLDRKESLVNIFKRKIHFCCGDKVRNSSKIFLSNKSSSKLSSILRSRNIGNRIAKVKKTSNIKSREVKDKFNFKSNASSPNVNQVILDNQKKRTHSKEFGDNEIRLRKKGFQIANFPIKNEEKTGLNDDIRWFSDTDLLKLHTEDRHMFQKKRRLRKIFCDEKSIQAKINTNDIEIQIDISNEEAKKSDEISSRNFATNTQLQPVQFYDDFKAINDYCTAILETKTNIEEVLKKCSSASSTKSVAIGCQSEGSQSIDSSSQTSSLALNTNYKSCNKMHLKTLNDVTTIKNYENTTRPKLNINRTKSSSNIRESVISEERTPRKVLLYLTLDASATGLDRKHFRSNMSCYCKEAPLDKKAKIEEERPRNLFEDEDDDVDYSEGYMQELINTIHLEEHTSICGSTPSLPDVAVGTDRCESRLEIPWLKISLAPPGYYEIKKQEGRPKKVLCDCWNLSASDDVYSEPVVQAAEEPVCKCTSKTVEEPKPEDGPKKSEVTFKNRISDSDENQKDNIEEVSTEEEIIDDKIDDDNIQKEPSLQKPASEVKTQSQTEEDTVDPPQKEPSEIEKKKESEKSATSTQREKSTISTQGEKSTISTQGEKSAISTQGEKSATSTLGEKSAISTQGEKSATSTLEKSNPKLTEKESKKSTISEQKSSEDARPIPEDEEKRSGEEEEVTAPLEEKSSSPENEDPNKGKDCPSSSSSSSSSLPSDCICLAQKECEDILGRPTAFVFDNPCFAQHEGYMDPIYKLFPDDCDTYCGPHIEMPWSDLTIPRKIKLRQAKRQVEPKSSSKCPCKPPEEVEPKPSPKCPCKPPEEVEPKPSPKCPCKPPEAVQSKSSSKRSSKPPEEVVVCGKKEDTASPTQQQVTPTSDNPETPVEKIDKSFEIQLSFTEIISNMAALENKCEPSGVSVSVRPTSKDRSACSEPRPSSYGCKCGSPRSKQNSPTAKKSKSKNTNCRCPSRDVSFARIESNTSHGSRCKNPSCKPSSPTGRSSRRSSDQTKPMQKSSYQDPVMNVLETCEAEMEPLRDTLNQLKCKIRNLNIPELNNWNNNPMQCPPCCAGRQMTSPTMPQQSSSVNRTSGMTVPPSMPIPSQNFSSMPLGPPHMPAPPSMPAPSQNFPSMPLAPPCMPAPSQNFPPMQMPPQFPFQPMFPPMPPLPQRGMPQRRCCPQCACKEIRPRKRSPRSASSSTEYSEYDSLSDEGSGCPFLRALSSSKNIYKDRDSRTQRKCRDRDDKRKGDRQSKKCTNCTAKKYNKRSQVEYSRQDICTDTEPEIQVHYGPKHPKMKTKHVFKGVIDKPNMSMSKNQRLRIAVRLSPSGQEVIDDNYLAIQGPCEYK